MAECVRQTYGHNFVPRSACSAGGSPSWDATADRYPVFHREQKSRTFFSLDRKKKIFPCLPAPVRETGVARAADLASFRDVRVGTVKAHQSG
jgi:hypothetical protein